MRLALWTPHAGRGWVAAVGPELAREVKLELVAAEPRSGLDADLHVYQVADDPAYGFVYRALLRQPGLVVLEEWSLNRLIHAETAGHGDEGTYRREARRAHGETGAFVARQVTRGLGGTLAPTLLRMNHRVLEASLGLVAASEMVRAKAAARLPGRPVVHLPLPFQQAVALRGAQKARADLGLARECLLVLAVHPPRDPSPAVGVVTGLERVRSTEPRAVVLWAREDSLELDSLLAAADVVVALEHPVRAGLGEAIPRAVAVGRPTLVTAGSGAALELPEGVVAHVSPGPTEVEEIAALVLRLLADESLRLRIGRLAQRFAAERYDPARCARGLLDLLRAVDEIKPAAVHAFAMRRAKEDTIASAAVEEVRRAARELGLAELPPSLAPLVGGLFHQSGR